MSISTHKHTCPEMCENGGVVRIPCSPVWPVSQPEGFHTVHIGRCRHAQTPGRTAGHVFGRLAPVGAVRTGGQGSHAHCHKTPNRFGFCDKYREEPTLSDTGDILSIHVYIMQVRSAYFIQCYSFIAIAIELSKFTDN